jgi:hypothetical protein
LHREEHDHGRSDDPDELLLAALAVIVVLMIAAWLVTTSYVNKQRRLPWPTPTDDATSITTTTS